MCEKECILICQLEALMYLIEYNEILPQVCLSCYVYRFSRYYATLRTGR